MRIWQVLFGVFAAVIVVGIVAIQREPDAIPEVGDPNNLTIEIPPDHGYGGASSGRQLDVTPDGKQIVYVAVDSTGRRLYLRVIGEATASPIAGTEGGAEPVFSPDGRSVAFWADKSLKVASLDGGPTAIVVKVNPPRGIAWLDADTLILGNVEGGLLRVSISRGESSLLPAPEGPQLPHLHPDILPGGKAILFTASGNSLSSARIHVLLTETGQDHELLDANGFAPRYVPTGHIVFAQGGSRTLMAARFDLEKLAIVGTPQKILDTPLAGQGFGGSTDFTFSASGVLAFRPRSKEDIDDVLAHIGNLDLNGIHLQPNWFAELKRRIP